MQEQELDQLMAESTKQFNELKVQEGGLKEQLSQIDTSLKQLQGEFEAYRTLKQTLQERAKGQNTQSLPLDTDPAALIDPGVPAEDAPPARDPFKAKESKKEAVNAAK